MTRQVFISFALLAVGLIIVIGLLLLKRDTSIPTFKGEIFLRQIGANFNIQHAKWLAGEWNGPRVGPKWQESLKEILSLKPAILRLSMQWENIETRLNHYDFSEIDEALELCEGAGVPVILCLGVKSPRWPEVHLPDFYQVAATEGAKNKELNTSPTGIKQPLLAFVATAARRYGQDPRIQAFQIENEPLEPFGDPALSVNLGFLKAEITLVRERSEKPLMVTFGAGLTNPVLSEAKAVRQTILDQLLTLDVDWIGLDLYQKGVVRKPLIGDVQFNASGDHWQLAADFVGQIRRAGKKAVIAELQMEPWEADASKMDFRDPQGNVSLKPADLISIYGRASELTIEPILLWGLEFQVACKHQGNSAWWEATKQIMKYQRRPRR